MIFDDHDVHDDWNISEAWVGRCGPRRGGTSASPARSCPTGSTSTSATWPRRSWPRSGCSPRSPRGDEDGGPRLREFARAVDREPAASRFAFYRDFGRSRLVVIDSRAARVLAEGRRDMVDDEEWQWIAEHARGAYDHLIIASTLPVFMTPGVRRARGVERGRSARAPGAASRRAPARSCGARSTSSTGRRSSARSGRWSSCCTSSPRGRTAPGTISFIGGDVHTAYVAEVDTRGAPEEPRLPDRLLAVQQPARAAGAARRQAASARAGAGIVGRALARAAGVRRPDVELEARLARDVRQLDRRARPRRAPRAAHDPAQRARERRRLAARAALRARSHAGAAPS